MVDATIHHLEEELKKVVEHLKQEYVHLQIGRASSSLVERLEIDSYGTMQNIKSVASISIPDARTIQIQPWDKGVLPAIEKAIQVSGLGLTPTNDGTVIRINIPALTEERRKDLTKLVHKMAEEAKIAVRNARQTAMEKIRAAHKNSEITEDMSAHGEKRAQEKVDHSNREIDSLAKGKENEILTI